MKEQKDKRHEEEIKQENVTKKNYDNKKGEWKHS